MTEADLGKPPRVDYYAQGSMETAETSVLVLNRLEAVSEDSRRFVVLCHTSSGRNLDSFVPNVF